MSKIMKFGEWEYTEDELAQQIKEATKRAEEADRTEPRATSASYDRDAHRVVINLDSGVTFTFPPELLQGLVDASPDDLAQIEMSSYGTSLRWEKLDADFSVPGLIAGLFGTRAWMASLGRKGGKVTSEAKAAAARANGQMGGRPRKPVAAEVVPAHGRPKESPKAKGRGSEMGIFEARLAESAEYQPAHVTRVLQSVSHFPVKTLDQATQLLEQDTASLSDFEDQEIVEGQMVQHPTPIVFEDTLIQKRHKKYPVPAVLQLELVG